MERFYDRFLGNLMVLFFFPSKDSPESVQELRGFAANLDALSAAGAAVVALSRDSVTANAAVRAELGIALPLYSDAQGAVTQGYGAGSGEGGHLCTSYVLDRNQHVLAVFSGGSDHAARALAHLRDRVPASPPARNISAQAPVLLVPEVFDPSLREKAVAAWAREHSEGEVSMPLRAYTDDAAVKPANLVYYTLKKRLDHVTDDTLNPVLMETVMTRLGPELWKAFQFRIGSLERICIGAYVAERQDYFRPHRDNITEGTKDRRFAVTIALNDDFEGGGVRFAEYSDDVYHPPAGAALVFSCSLLHEALPVTRGTRLAAFTFLFGPGHRADKPFKVPG